MNKFAALIGLFFSLLVATPASAAVYTYTTGSIIGQIDVTIDTTAQTATLTGPNINLVMTDSDLANFDPNNVFSTGNVTADSVSGTYTWNGTTYNAQLSSNPNDVGFCFSGPARDCGIALFGAPVGGGDAGRFITRSYLTPTSSTGGTPVSEPGMLGLFGFGLGAAGFAAYRRRKTK